MIASEKQSDANSRKQKIRDRYKGVDPSLLEVIPAKPVDEVSLTDKVLKVAAYVRVSTENDEQTSSYELQVRDFTERIKANPNWEFAGIYSDEGISGTELSHRKGMLQLIEDAKAGKVQHILAKSIARFARNVVDCLSIIDELRQYGVGVHFDESNLYTLDTTGALVLTILATVAEEESRSKSFIMNWSIERRFSNGIFLTPGLLGYDKDEEGNLVINDEEAETVKVIYDLYINGWSSKDIAKLLTECGRKTKRGNVLWSSSSITSVIENERHCGDVLSRKTFTPNFKDHKSKKNVNDRTQYRQRDHHNAIVSRDVFNAANVMKSARLYSSQRRALPVLSVVKDGILKGYVPVDKNWTGFSAEDYQTASESVDITVVKNEGVVQKGRRLNMEGYQIVRSAFFPTNETPSMTITNGTLRFNTACLKKFENVEYVELLLNSVTHCIAIRPCSDNNPNAIRWGRLKEERWVTSRMSCRGLAKTLFGLMPWEEKHVYKFSGQFRSNGDEKLLVFELGEPVVTKEIEHIIIPQNPDDLSEAEMTEIEAQMPAEEIVIKEKVRVYPVSWKSSFGEPIKTIAHVNYLEQQHYAGDWDVLRPATEVPEGNTFATERIDDLLREAEMIIEGWKKTA